MQLELTAAQREARATFRAFAQEEIAPRADGWDRDEKIPLSVVEALAERGWLGSLLSPEVGGAGLEPITYGLLTEEMGKACSSVRSLLTVHDMLCQAIDRWGKPAVKEHYLPRLARGEIRGALALSEPGAGSDASAIATRAELSGDRYLVTGTKRWITFGQIADVFLLFARTDGGPAAFVLDRETEGLGIEPITGMMGTRASMLAELRLDRAPIPVERMLGRPGFGISHVAANALELGRYSVAWGSVGIAQASLDASEAHAASRQAFGERLADHQLIRAMLTEMTAGVRAARLLCCRAGYLRAQGDPGAFMETMVAKYYASTVATRAAADAVQIHGALGLSADSPVGRYLRDSRVMEIIEGSTQIQQITIPQLPLAEL